MSHIFRFRSFKRFLIAMALTLFFIACEKDKGNENEPEFDNVMVSEWILGWMKDIYLWQEQVADEYSTTSMSDPKAFFKSMLSPDDRFSYITDDYQKLEADFKGSPVSMGYSPHFTLLEAGSEEVIIIIEYVYKGSPADEAGLKRGDIISRIDGIPLYVFNYSELFNQESYEVELAEVNDGNLTIVGGPIQLEARTVEANPFIYDTIFNVDSKKVGYMVTTQFNEGEDLRFVSTLEQILKSFNDNTISSLIVDLRYNPGGTIDMAQYLASCFVPQEAIENQDVFAKMVYNDTLDNIIRSGGDTEFFFKYFVETENHLNLNKIFFLTSKGSASASELLIIGLQPYMDVYVFGEPTFGKYVGSWLFYDEHEPRLHSWAIMPIVFKYANADGFSDFTEGLEPDVYINDDMYNTFRFGDKNDPILKDVLLSIKQNTIPKTKKAMVTGSSNSLKLDFPMSAIDGLIVRP